MRREQEDEREDDDQSKAAQQTKLVTPALAGLTTLLAASPILSVSPGKEEEERKETEEHERKCIRIPDDDSFIVPLHGDSDEELNPDRYKDPLLVTMQKTTDVVVETPKGTPSKRKVKDKAPKAPKAKIKSGSEGNSKKLVTPALAGLSAVIAATPIITEPSENRENVAEDDQVRTIIRTPDKSAVIVPLHGGSDENLHPEWYSDPSLLTTQRIDGPVIEEYDPLNHADSAKMVEAESKLVEVPKTPTKKAKSEKSSDGPKMVTASLAGMTTLLAASPILTKSKEEQECEEPKEEARERKYIRIPNEEAVIIPLHGDSDEEINPERYEDQSLVGVQKIGETIEEIKPTKTTEGKASKNSKSKSSGSDSKMVTPMLAGMTTLLAASPILTKSKEEQQCNEESKEEVRERKFIRVADQEGVIIPLHGDSDEEINPERYEDPSMIGVQNVGEVEVIKPQKVKAVEASKSHSVFKKEEKSATTAGKTVTPMLAGLTTLLAASPILSTTSDEQQETKEEEGEKTEEPKDKEDEVRERKFIRIPNEQGVIIPLHGDSDEELNPERYEDPSLQGVQRIGEEIQPIKASKVESKASDKKTTISGGKMVTPMLAGMATLLAASPILSVSPKEESEDTNEVSDNPEDKPLERKFIKTKDEKSIIIPLHGDSDEELHPERYDDPSMVGIQKIEGPTLEDFKPPPPEKKVKGKSKVLKIKQASQKAKEEAAKVVMPMLAGMTTLLASSPLLTVSPQMEEGDDQRKVEQSKDEQGKDEQGKDETEKTDEKVARMADEKPLERKVIKLAESRTDVIVPLHGDSDEELHPERYDDPSMVDIQKIEGPTLEDFKPPPPEKKEKGKSKVLKIKQASQKAKEEAAKVVMPMLAGMTTLLASSPLLTVSPQMEEGDDQRKVEQSKDEQGKDEPEKADQEAVRTVDEKPLERKVIKIAESRTDVIVPLHGDSDEELHPERYNDPSMVAIQKIEGPTMAEIRPLAPVQRSESVKSSKIKKIKKATEHVTKEAAKMVTPMLAGMTTLLASSPLLTVSPKKEEEIPESNAQDITIDTNKVDDSIERKFIRIPDQEAVIVPLHGDSDEELHPDRYENPSLQGVHSITGSVVEESIPPPKPNRTKARPKSGIQTEVVQQINNEVHLARDHEYEPVNPKEPPPSPSTPVQDRQSRRDQAEEKKIGAALTSAAVAATTAASGATAEVAVTVPAAAAAPAKPVEKPVDPPPPAPSKLVTPSLAGLTTLLAASPILTVAPKEPDEEKKDEVLERKFIRIPNEEGIIIPLHGDSDEELHPERYKDPALQGIQRIEGPTVEVRKPPPKEVPTPKEAPKPESKEQSVYEPIQNPDDMALDEALPLSFQDRFKAGAGEIRDKLKNMSVPKISLPDRPKINLSEMKLPERPQFLKERPQFLKERPQFLKERPQFLKERPQFLKEKPKFLTERPKFLKEKPKFLTERPKINFPDSSKFKVPEKFKIHKAKRDKPKIRKPNPSSLRRPLRDVVTVTGSSESSPNFFETLKARTYPRFLSKKKRALRQGTSIDTESSPPSPPDHRKLFPDRYRDIKFADEEPGYQDQSMDVHSEEGYEENTAPFRESYVRSAPYIAPQENIKAKIDSSSDIAGESDKEQISSGASSMRHRAGVLEEIDSDEFFLRQKGLSREDVDVSRYLSREIRDAFRPPKQAVSHMDSTEGYDDEFEDEEENEQAPPEPPERKRSKSRRSESRESDFNTFPMKPTRRKHSEPDFGSKEIFEKVRKPPRKYHSKSSIRSLDRTSRRSILDEVPRPPSRQKSLRSLTRSRPESAADVRGGSVRGEVAHSLDTPARPLRKSSSRGASIDERTSRGGDSLPQDYGEYEQDEEEMEGEEEEMEEEEILEEEQQAREHVQVFHTAPLTSEVRLRSSVDDESIPGYATVRKPKPPRPPPPPKSRKELIQTQLQNQFHNIKSQGMNFFQTFPRRAMKSLHKPRLPVRPLRNYSSLGPVRPPRRSRVFREPVYVEGDMADGYEGTSDQLKDQYDMKHEYEETRDLQSGEIVEKMKGRPLPAPPRPPRRLRDDEESLQSADARGEFEDEREDVDVLEQPARRDEFFAAMRINIADTHSLISTEEENRVRGSAHPTIETSQQTSFEVPDVSVSIQTDPLPEGFIVDESEQVARRREMPPPLPERKIVDDALRRSYDQHDPRRLFDPEVVRASEEESEEPPPPLPQRAIPPPITIPPVQVSFPDKLHLAQLDVDRLNVNELQANTIKVSDIESVTMQISEISATSGNLILNGVELPPDFIKNLVAQIPVPQAPEVIKKVITLHEKVTQTTETIPQPQPQPIPERQMKRMLTPPPPIVVQHSAQSADEVPSPPVMQASTTEQLPKPKTTRIRRKSPTRVVDDSEDELSSVVAEKERKERERVEKELKKSEKKVEDEPKQTIQDDETAPSPAPPAHAPEQTAFNLIKQLVSLWYRNIMSGTESLLTGVNAIFPDNDKRRDAQMAALILIVIIATLVVLGLGADQSVHHHHWDYLNPPR